MKGMQLAGKSPYSGNKGFVIENSPSKGIDFVEKSSYGITKL